MTNKQDKTIALISAFPPGKQTLNEYGYHLAINFAQDPNVSKVVIVADRLLTPEHELYLGSKIEVQRIWDFNSFTSLPKILRALRRIKPDLAIYNLQTASFGDKEVTSALGLLTPMCSHMLKTPSGIIAHNMISGINLDDTILKGQKLRQKIVKLGAAVIDWAMLHASYITFTLTSYADHYRTRFPRANIYHIPHGTFDTETRKLSPIEERDNVLVTMGKFGTYKRLETLLRAIEILRDDFGHKDLRLIIGGSDHPNTQGYMKSVEESCKGQSHIQFHGYVAEDDMPEFFGQAKVSVFDYSSTTGSSGVLHQTASYGAVPVFPAIGDFVDACENEGLEGINYEPNNARDMARAIEIALEDQANSKRISAKNRKASEDMPFSEIIGFHLSQVEIDRKSH